MIQGHHLELTVAIAHDCHAIVGSALTDESCEVFLLCGTRIACLLECVKIEATIDFFSLLDQCEGILSNQGWQRGVSLDGFFDFVPLKSDNDVLPACAILAKSVLNSFDEKLKGFRNLAEERHTHIVHQVSQDDLVIQVLVSEHVYKISQIFMRLLMLSKGVLEVLFESILLLLLIQVLKSSLDKLDGVGLARSDVNFLISSIRLTKSDVCRNVSVPEEWLLHDVTALLSEGAHIVLI